MLRSGIHNRTLNANEAAILLGLVAGQRIVNIARAHRLSLSQAYCAASTLYTKLGASNKVEAVTLALELHPIELDQHYFYGS